MRHLPTRTTRHRVVGALAAALLCAAGLGTEAVASGTPAAQAAPAEPAPAGAQLGEGLAPTPPMGFNNWNSTHCRAEFNEAMVKGIADIFVAKGLKEAGYEYVNLDDCWALPQRDANGKLVPDPARFPSGIKAVADCTTVSAQVGVDDEKGTRGTVAFEIWADGTKAASTGVLTNTMSAQPISADVSGAKVVRLVVTDGGDGVDSDHADWADLRIGC